MSNEISDNDRTFAERISKVLFYISNRPFLLTLLAVFIIGLITNGFAYSNVELTHDSVGYYGTDDSLLVFIRSGRYLQPLTWLLRDRIGSPWLWGLTDLSLIALIVFAIVKTLKIKRAIGIVFLSGIMIANVYIISGTATYINYIDDGLLSYLTAAVAAYLVCQNKRGRTILAILLLSCSLGFVQTGITMYVGIVIIMTIKRLFEGDSFTKSAWKYVAKSIIVALAAAILYLIILNIVLRTLGTTLTEYKGISSFYDFTGYSIYSLIVCAYKEFFTFFTAMNGFNTRYTLAAYVVLFAIGLLMFIKAARTNHTPVVNIILIIICVILLPLGVNLIYIAAKGEVYALTSYAFYLVFALLFLIFEYINPINTELSDALERRNYAAPVNKSQTPYGKIQLTIGILASACMCVILFNAIVYANNTYFEKKMTYDTTLEIMTNVRDDMLKTDGYDQETTQVAFIGSLDDNPAYAPDDIFSSLVIDPTGNYNNAVAGDTLIPLTNNAYYYFKNILFTPIVTSNYDAATQAKYEESGKNMPIYPYDGYCQIIDGTLIVKLADPDES